MRIVGIEKKDIKRVIKKSTYGFDYVELQNGAKVIVNQRPIFLGGTKVTTVDGKGKFEEVGSECIFNYPMLERILDDGKGGIEFDDKKMKEYITSRFISCENGSGYFDYMETPQSYAESVLKHMKEYGSFTTGGVRSGYGWLLDHMDAYTDVNKIDRIPLEAFQNHPNLLGEISKAFDKKLLSMHDYVEKSKSQYSKKELKWLEEGLEINDKRTDVQDNISKTQKALDKIQTK